MVSCTAVAISSREEYGMHILSTALQKVVMRLIMKRRPPIRALPIVILGQLFCFSQGRLNSRRKEMGFPDSI
jgi:hypothetical protein